MLRVGAETFESVLDLVTYFREKHAIGHAKSKLILVLFDGAGLMRLGLERCGHICVGVELDPVAHHLGQYVGSGNCIQGDATKCKHFIPLFDCVHASPPCQKRSAAAAPHNKSLKRSAFETDHLTWCYNLLSEFPDKYILIENIRSWCKAGNTWGEIYNAAQFTQNVAIQNRNRCFGGRYPKPGVLKSPCPPSFVLRGKDFGPPCIHRHWKLFFVRIFNGRQKGKQESSTV